MQPYFSDQFYNPSATYLPAQQVRRDLESARTTVAHWLGARPAEIIFSAGGTEANNLAIQGIMRRFPDASVVISAIEHDSVRAPASRYAVRTAAVLADGRINLDDLRTKIDDKTVLVSIGYANNEIGTVQPVREISRLLRRIAAQRSSKVPLYLHTDACQAGNYLDLHVARLGVDLLTLNGGKLYGPKQSGALYVKGGVELEPLVVGGGQERGLRSGTENVAASIGFATVLDIAQHMRHDEVERLQGLQRQLMDALTGLPGVTVNGSVKYRLPNNVHVTFAGHDNERLLIQLEEQGVLAAAGSACSASDEEPSHVLRAIGLDDAVAQASLRFTLGRPTTGADITKTIQVIRALL